MNVSAFSGPPRAVRLSGTGILFRVITVILAATFALALSWPYKDYAVLKQLRANGRETTGTIVNKTIARGKSTSYYVEYEVNGVSAKDQVSSSSYEGYQIGQQSPVTVDPNDPNAHRLGKVDDERVAGAMHTFLGIASILVSVTVLFGVIMETIIRKERKLLKNGIALPGKIVSAQPGGKTMKVTFEYVSPDGRQSTGTENVSGSKKDWPQAGADTVVLYDPSKPSASRTIEAISTVRLG